MIERTPTGRIDKNDNAIHVGDHIFFNHDNPEKAYGGLVVQVAAEDFFLDVPEFPSYLSLDILPVEDFEIVPAPGEKT